VGIRGKLARALERLSGFLVVLTGLREEYKSTVITVLNGINHLRPILLDFIPSLLYTPQKLIEVYSYLYHLLL